MINRSNRAVPVSLASLGVLSLVVAGCAKPTEFESVVNDLSPEMVTPTERKTDVSGHLAYTNDLNLRNFWADLGRVWHTDRPSRLSPYPVPDAAGTP